jgi:hypothetical protein
MLKTLKNFTDGLTAKTILIFALMALPFIILPFMIVSNSQRTDARINAPQIIPANAFTITAFLPPSEIIFPHAHIGYDRSVLRAVREMGLVLDHLNMWIDQYPDTALSHVIFMPVAMQQNVASIALFIRKTNARIDEKTAWREAAAFVHYSAKYGVPVALTTAVAKAESTFDPDAQSPKGASGVMQVMWKIHQGLLNSNGIHASSSSNPLSDPEKAIAAGSLLLSRYLRAYGSLQAAMNRYSGGASSSYLHKVNRNIASIMNHHAELMK